MQTDPFSARRTGFRRLRVLTTSLGAAAVVGTGALAWSMAAPTPTAASTDDAHDSTVTTTSTSDDDQFVPPSQLPGTTTLGGSHASSGAS